MDTLFFRRLRALFFLEAETRRMHLAEVTPHPTGVWVTQQARNVVMALYEAMSARQFLTGIAIQSSPDRSTRSSAPKASGSFLRPSELLGRTLTRSAGSRRYDESAWTGSSSSAVVISRLWSGST